MHPKQTTTKTNRQTEGSKRADLTHPTDRAGSATPKHRRLGGEKSPPRASSRQGWLR